MALFRFNYTSQNMKPLSEEEIEQSLEDGARSYFAECRARIPEFTKANFSYPGCWHLNKVAIGWDLLRAPLNLFWAPVYAFLQIMAFGCAKLGWVRTEKLLKRAPGGFTTRVQKHISEKVYTDLLQRSTRGAQADRLYELLVTALEEKLENKTGLDFDHQALYKRFEPLIKDTLEQYQITRTASADITNGITSTIIGAFAFKKFTPGGLGIGFLIAAAFAKSTAANSFIFGATAGSLYYSLFPPEPSLALITVSTLITLCFLAFFASVSGLIFDPIQYRTKLHAQRLRKMINKLEADFIAKNRSSYHPKDQYVARIMDIFDALKSHIIP